MSRRNVKGQKSSVSFLVGSAARMIHYPIRSTFTFLGVKNPSWKRAKVVLLPVPYDGTTSYQSGARFGPEAIVSASTQLELFDEELGFETISRVPIYTLDPLEPQLDHPGDMVEEVRKAVRQIRKTKKFPFLLGGEHSLTFGAVMAIAERRRDVSILHLDAHADFRNAYEGTRFNHACVMRRCIDVVDSITSVGVRSIAAEDMAEHQQFSKRHHIFTAPHLPLARIVNSLQRNVYITVDLDVLDNSIMPSTGTSQPGGLNWYQVLEVIRAVTRQRRVIGADVMELMPIGGLRAPDFLAAKLVYKMIGAFFFPKLYTS